MYKQGLAGSIGASCSKTKIGTVAKNHLNAKLELKRLGDKPRPIHHSPRMDILRLVQEQESNPLIEVMHALIDYRNNNKVIKKKAMTRLRASKNNKLLEGSGMAWARVGS